MTAYEAHHNTRVRLIDWHLTIKKAGNTLTINAKHTQVTTSQIKQLPDRIFNYKASVN